MIREVVTTVDLDTAEAKSKLRDLDKRKGQTKRRARSQVWGKLRSRVGQTFGTVAGYASISAVGRMHSGPVDPWSAALLPIQAEVQQKADALLGFSVIARRRARDEAVARLRFNVGTGAKGALAASFEFFGETAKFTEQEEAGRNIVRQVLRGPELDELIEQATKGYALLLEKAFDYVREEMIK